MVLDKVISLISEQFHLEETQITEETSFDELGADEMDLAEIVLAAESEFEIELDEELDLGSCVSDLVDLVEAALFSQETTIEE